MTNIRGRVEGSLIIAAETQDFHGRTFIGGGRRKQRQDNCGPELPTNEEGQIYTLIISPNEVVSSVAELLCQD